MSGGGDKGEWGDSDNDIEWKPVNEALQLGDGPVSRLLRAVNQSDYPPIRSEWTKYIVELGWAHAHRPLLQSSSSSSNAASGTYL